LVFFPASLEKPDHELPRAMPIKFFKSGKVMPIKFFKSGKVSLKFLTRVTIAYLVKIGSSD